MKKDIRIIILLVAVFHTVPLSVASANTEANVLQIYINEQTMTVFTNIGLQADGLNCKVANQNAVITATGSLADDAALIKTTVLVDISTNICEMSYSDLF